MPTPEAAWRVAVIDSGLDLRSGITPLASRRFVDDQQRVMACAMTGDATGHGTAVTQIITSSAAASKSMMAMPELLMAQVMDGDGATPASVAAAILWAVEGGAHLIHLSLGLATDRSVLAAAVDAATDAGVVMVAATPARGTASFPARYPGVIRATGDARCAAQEISALDSRDFTYGAHASFTASSGRLLRGSSIGAAHVTRFILSHVPSAAQPRDIIVRLTALASYRGRENRAVDSSAESLASSG